MTDEQKLIGLSLSFCVKDILQGKVDKGQVFCILTSCRPPRGVITPDNLPPNYFQTYWKKYTEDEVKEALLGIPLYPRHPHYTHNIGEGHWLVCEQTRQTT